jgi:putative hydrolase of the HAD superfamily
MNSPKKKYTTLFFDFDNTLWDFDKNSFFALRETFKFYGLEFTDGEFETIFSVYSKHNERMWELYRAQEIKKNELVRQRFSKTFAEVGILGVDPVDFNAKYLEEMPKQPHLVDGSREILDYLFTRYNLYIITNGFREVQHKKLENTMLSGYFKKVFISEDIKAPKPSREFFEFAIKSANAKKKKSLIIGDDWEADIVGALNFGLDQVYYSRLNGGFEMPAQIGSNKPLTYKINQLSQLTLFL